MANFADWELDSLRKRLWISRGGYCVLTEREREIASTIIERFDGDLSGDDWEDDALYTNRDHAERTTALDMIREIGLYDDLKGRVNKQEKETSKAGKASS